MAYLIGIDEAGYGPFLGPLCIGATLWQIPDSQHTNEFDLYDELQDCVTTTLKDKSRIMVGDSKLAYKPKSGLQNLERAVHTFTNLLSLQTNQANTITCPDFQSWMKAIGIRWQAWSDTSPWFKNYNCELPVDVNKSIIPHLQTNLETTLSALGIKFLDAKVMCIPAARFNYLLNSFPTKGALLSHCSLELAQSIVANQPPAPLLVHCDKHGGRNRYSHLLQQLYPDYWIDIAEESTAISRYYFGPPDQRVQFRFVAKGEGFLPTALASMYAKYTRELSMQAFNQYWQQHVKDIKPTAGYPQDARRFRAEIEDQLQNLNILEEVLWRRS
ncbi:MAG: hypothetical protein HN617_17870 [Planctomycetaceae bacterium]|jgi:ribonuclease HII|nr:hypothetical protein [Planctomycetaceae bacterium]MBT4012873.1 hypothetical protein [Planctomycetaceae bacterium]MBT4725919.1 hypothetical protein [Planctomycetaceae bacterium]MBT4844773.1 hypothetical protein [Planctomycetaceae bacterium]MBT5123145.1 hypothetical protein [Planctomycetaceae bacterium]